MCRALGLVCLVLFLVRPARAADGQDVDLPVGAFSLTERSGRTVTNEDLLGKVWVASFQFTRCADGCPQVSETMKRLQADLAGRSDVVLVTFTVDPKHDKLDELRAYADGYGANPERWLFLTGEEDEIYRLMYDSFKLPKPKHLSSGSDGSVVIDHTFRLVLVDQKGHVRGYYDGKPSSLPPGVLTDAEEAKQAAARDHEASLKKLKKQIDVLRQPSFLPADVPQFNALLNAIAAGLLLLGYAAVRQRLVRLHVACMLLALGVSALFLASYLYYHLVVKVAEPTRFTEQAVGAPQWAYYLYMAVLGTHTVLAVVAAPLALFTAYQGLRNRIARHVRVARWALPIWLYVSVTGVVVYVMLYRLYAGD